MTVRNLLNTHAQELESMTRNVSGITPTSYINIPDTRNDLSISEQAAQRKIYDMYQNTQNGQQEPFGCGTAAEIAYLGHKSTCEEFQWIHERSSYEMLLANLQKRKKVTLFGNYQQQKNKRPRLQSTSDSGNQEEITKNAKTDVHMDNPSTPTTPTTATNSLTVLAEVAQSHLSQSSLPDLIGEQMVELIAHVKKMKTCHH